MTLRDFAANVKKEVPFVKVLSHCVNSAKTGNVSKKN